jgi:hypothetical protein
MLWREHQRRKFISGPGDIQILPRKPRR